MEEQFYTFDIFYSGTIEMELDMEIKSVIEEYLYDNFNIDAEWYYSEFTTTTPTYRLIGFELSKQLVEIERLQLIQYLSDKFNGYVLPQ
jgi:hypothetical protein